MKPHKTSRCNNAKHDTSIPSDLHSKMKKHSDVRWSEVVRKVIPGKIEALEMMDKMTKKSKLTEKDVDELAHNINRTVFEDLNKR